VSLFSKEITTLLLFFQPFEIAILPVRKEIADHSVDSLGKLVLCSDNTASASSQNVYMDDVSIGVDVQLLLLNRFLDRTLSIEDIIEFLELW
jgi:hypothetical protein